MTMHALLAWFGLRAAPHFHDKRVHDAIDADTAMISGLRVMARQSVQVSQVMTSDPANEPRIRKGIDDMRAIMAEVARRADR